MGLQNQLNRRSTKGTKYKSLCNDNKRRRNIESVVRQTTEGQTNSEIKVKIHSIMLLYSKEEQITTIGIGLQEIGPSNKLDLIWEYNNIQIKKGDE